MEERQCMQKSQCGRDSIWVDQKSGKEQAKNKLTATQESQRSDALVQHDQGSHKAGNTDTGEQD